MHKDYRITCPAFCEVLQGNVILGFVQVRLRQVRSGNNLHWAGKCSSCGRELKLIINRRDVRMEKLAAQTRAASREAPVGALS